MTARALSREQLLDAQSRGLSVSQLAREAGCHRNTAVKSASDYGVALRRGNRLDGWPTPREIVQPMAPLDAVAFLLELIDALVAPVPEVLDWRDTGLALTVLERRLVMCLAERPGRTVPREWLLRALYGDRSVDEWPAEKTLDVHICHARRKLCGSGMEIRTEWGVGFSLHAPAGYVWPWGVRDDA